METMLKAKLILDEMENQIGRQNKLAKEDFKGR